MLKKPHEYIVAKCSHQDHSFAWTFNVKVSWKELFKAKAFSGLVVGRIPVYLVFMNVAPFVKEKVTKAMNKV